MVSMEENSKEVAELLKVLANNNRLLILCALLENNLTVTELSKFVPNISQSSLSQHLSILKSHNILDCNKSGQNVTYFISDKRISALFEVLKTQYCS